MIRGIRGAITTSNTIEDISHDSVELVKRIMDENNICEDDIASVLFTMTKDLNAVYPAKAIREVGFKHVPLVCYQELDIVNSLKNCIRVLMHVNTEKSPEEIHHVYLKGARVLRPDLLK